MTRSVVSEVRSTCPYCGVGCGVIIEARDGQIAGVRGDPAHPANFGRLCSKGSTLHLTASAAITRQARLLRPLRRERFGEPLQPVGWDAALGEAAERFASIIERHGPDAVGLYLSGQMLTEDYYVFNKLGKGLIGTNNVDSNSRLCMSSAVAGYKATLGADAPPVCYDDLGLSNTVLIAGSNMAWAHPVLHARLEDARRARPAMKVIVADPRRTETAALADLHLQLLPGSDVALFHGLLHLLLWEGLCDHAFITAHTSGFEALRDRVREFTPRHVAQTCGLQEADIVQAARWFGRNTPTLSLYCQGLNQSRNGTDKNVALINLHLATGQIGKPGAGPFALTGQSNAMGGREVGAMANLLSAHRDLGNAEHRAEVAALWGIDAVPAAPGKSAVQMFEAAADGEIRALWIVCTNPAQSMPDQATVRRALERCEYVVLQEAFANTATARYAHLLLPASSWGEKAGTVTNSERRISRVRSAVPPPGEARHDWAIGVDFARRLERRLGKTRSDGGSLFPYADAEAVWNEHRASTRGRDLDITGLSWAKLGTPHQWPFPQEAADGRPRLYEDGVFATADGRARFADVAWRALAEERDARFPLSLTTGRHRDQWHGMSRTGTLSRLFGQAAEPAIELHPQELARRGWKAGELLRVQSRRGEMVLPVQPSESVAPAQAFIAMHWGEEFVGGRARDGGVLAGVNALTPSACCPHSRQPELKHTAIRVEPAALPWQLQAAAWLPADEMLHRRGALQALLQGCGYVSAVPCGREPDGRVGLVLRTADLEPIARDGLQAIEMLLDLAGAQVLRYADTQRGQHRSMRLAEGGEHSPLQGFLLAGDIRALDWVLPLWRDAQPAAAFGARLLAGSAQTPAVSQPRGVQVCSCHDVSEVQIRSMLSTLQGGADTRLARLQERLRCGTNCGSCMPALRMLVGQCMGAA